MNHKVGKLSLLGKIITFLGEISLFGKKRLTFGSTLLLVEETLHSVHFICQIHHQILARIWPQTLLFLAMIGFWKRLILHNIPIKVEVQPLRTDLVIYQGQSDRSYSECGRQGFWWEPWRFNLEWCWLVVQEKNKESTCGKCFLPLSSCVEVILKEVLVKVI